MPTYEQPNRTTVTDKDGKQKITIKYTGDAVASQPTVSNAALSSKTVVSSVASLIETQYEFETVTSDGGGSNNDPANYNSNGVEVAGSLRTVPIQAHPRYATLTAEEQKAVKDFVENPIDGSKAFPASWSSYTGVTTMTELATKLLSGVESYYEPSVIVRKTFFSSGLPTGTKLGKIKSPGVHYAAAPTGANWLLINQSARGVPGNYTVTEEYELSGQGGWDSALYT